MVLVSQINRTWNPVVGFNSQKKHSSSSSENQTQLWSLVLTDLDWNQRLTVILVTSFSNTCISVLVLVPHINRAGNPVPGSVFFFNSFLVLVPVSKIRPSSDSILTYRNQYQFISDLTKQVLAQHQLLPLSTSTRGVSHCGLVIYIKKYLKKKKNY